MEDLPNVSEALYVRLCCDKSIGTEREVTIRRELMDMDELIQKSLNKHIGRTSMKSGSSREGFRFKSSDQDTMMWRTANKVICELSQGMFLDGSIHNIILMEHSGTPQGFVKLELLTPARSKELVSAVVVCKNRCYISSQRFRSHHYHYYTIQELKSQPRVHRMGLVLTYFWMVLKVTLVHVCFVNIGPKQPSHGLKDVIKRTGRPNAFWRKYCLTDAM